MVAMDEAVFRVSIKVQNWGNFVVVYAQVFKRFHKAQRFRPTSQNRRRFLHKKPCKCLYLRVHMLVARKYILLFIAILSFTACGEYGKIYKGKDNQAKYKLALELDSKKDYSRAVPLYEQFRECIS